MPRNPEFEKKINRLSNGEFGRKPGENQPGQLPDSVNDWISYELDREYPSREEAVSAALDLESYTEGVNINRKGDGWGLTGTEDAGFVSCDIYYDKDGRVLLDTVDFGMDAPDAYQIKSTMNVGGWDSLEPVQKFLNGEADHVKLYTVTVSGWVQPDDTEEDSEIVDTELCAICADEGDKADWHDVFGDDQNARDVLERVQNGLNTHPGFQAWPGSEVGVLHIGRELKPTKRSTLRRLSNGSYELRREWLAKGKWYPEEQIDRLDGKRAADAALYFVGARD